MVTKINPTALNDKWGGIICLNLSNEKPNDFDEILKILEDVCNNKKHYLISVFDTELNRFLGDCEIVEKIDSNITQYYIEQTKIQSTTALNIYRYYFNSDKTYLRSVKSIPLT